MPDFIFAVPGSLEAPTGGYAYARHLLSELAELRLLPLPAGFPHPDEVTIDKTMRLLAATSDGAILLIDGLAFGALPASRLARLHRPIVALVHHPLYLETGLDAERKAALRASERAAFAHAKLVVTTSISTARLLETEFGMPRGQLRIAEPGCIAMSRTRGRMDPPRMLSVGAVIPRKGYDVLLKALVGLNGDWRLDIAGAIDRDPAYVGTIQRMVAVSGLHSRITLVGAVSDETLRDYYTRADLFVTASHHEGYGMAVAAALSAGLPIVCTSAGTLAATLPVEAGLMAPPDDPGALRAALWRMLHDGPFRKRCAEASWRAGLNLPTWSETARRIRVVLESLAGGKL